MAYTTINKGSSYFNTITWTGNGATSRSLTGVGFKPDFLWVKCRNQGSFSHTLSDAVRGSTKTLFSNLTNAEINNYTYGYVTSYDTDGFSAIQGASSIEQYNTNADTYVAWNWLGANTTASNTSGSITSTVSANTTSGFSIVSYTGTNANATVGHGLGVAPKMVIVKSRSDVASWHCYHSGLTNANYYILLNSTAAQASQTSIWQGTTPTSSVFSIGVNGSTNASGQTYIAYCFAEVKGYSKFGSYIGNGSTDGTFIYTGFKPAMVIIKVSSTTENWVIRDNKRDTFNNVYKQLLPNASSAEDTSNDGRFSNDFLSNGFKLRATHASTNQSGATYIYMAFAENPFVSSKGIPTTAR